MPTNFSEIPFMKRVIMLLGIVVLSAPAAIYLIDNYTKDLNPVRAWVVLGLTGFLHCTKHLSKSFIKDNRHPNLIYVANFLVAGAAVGIHIWSVYEILSSDSNETGDTNTVKIIRGLIVDNGEEEITPIQEEDDTTEQNENKADTVYYIAILVFNILCLVYHLFDVLTAENESSKEFTGYKPVETKKRSSQDIEMPEYDKRRSST